jgi:hypothetical protein
MGGLWFLMEDTCGSLDSGVATWISPSSLEKGVLAEGLIRPDKSGRSGRFALDVVAITDCLKLELINAIVSLSFK